MQNVNLQEILKDYEDNLCDRLFEYELLNGQSIQVAFYREQMCHLLGLQYVFEHNHRYLGLYGFDRIKDGNITAEKMKKHNKEQYNFIKERLHNFEKIKQLMNEGEFIKFYQERANPSTKIQADFIIFQKESAHILHLFLRKEQRDKNIYAPVSFVIKSFDDRKPYQFIDKQEYKQIVKRTITIKTV